MIKERKTDYSLLVVDDEPLIRESLFEILRIEGFQVQMCATGEEALELMDKSPVDIILTDLKLPRMSGIDLLTQIKQEYPQTDIIVITGYGSIETAVEAMKKGAYDYITKPINDNEIQLIIDKIVEKKKIIEENQELKEIISKEQRASFSGMIGSSEKMQQVYHIIESVASSNATILITGESGTGKGMVARAIHDSDAHRKDKPFVEISCGALTETLLESELFGHVKGAFTGAIKDKEGRFEYASGGTIFLDEIDAFTPNLQVKLLKFLQNGEFERVGDNVSRKANARIIVATNRHIPELVQAGSFREDLYYRINVISIQMPPLRDRRSDIEAIADYYVKHYAKANGKNITGLSDNVRQLFKDYQWPGNIRELQNAIEGAVIMCKASTLDQSDIPNATKFVSEAPAVRSSATQGARESVAVSTSEAKSLREATEEPEREHIIAVLEECNWNRNKAAATLGVNRTTLYNKMKKYNIAQQK